MKEQPPSKVGWEVLGDAFFLTVVAGVAFVAWNNDAVSRYIDWLLTIKF